MTEKFVWDTYGDQFYSSDYGSQQLTGEYFSKAPGTSFAMNAQDQTLTLLPSDSSLWGTTHDVLLPPVKVALERGSLIVRPGDGTDNEPVNFTMGPFLDKHTTGAPTVRLSITEAEFALSGFDKIRAGGIGHRPQINLELDLSKTGYYSVDCATYHSGKRLSISDNSAARIRANEISLKNGIYQVKRTLDSSPTTIGRLPLDVESKDGGTMQISDLTVRCLDKATAIFRSKHCTFHGTNTLSTEQESGITIASDKIPSNNDLNFAFQIEAGSGEIVFDSYSRDPLGDLPFDFIKNTYLPCLFNFVTTNGINSTKIRIFGIGNAFQRFQMEEMKIVAINGTPPDKWKNVINCQYGDYLTIWLQNPSKP